MESTQSHDTTDLSNQQKAAESQQQQLIAYVDEQVKIKLSVYNLDVQRILQASHSLESLHKIVGSNEEITKIANELTMKLTLLFPVSK